MKLPLGRLLDTDDISDKELKYLLPYFRFDGELDFFATTSAMLTLDYKPVNQLLLSDDLFLARPPLGLIKRIICFTLVKHQFPEAEDWIIKDTLFYQDFYKFSSQERTQGILDVVNQLLANNLSTLIELWWNSHGCLGWHTYCLKIKHGIIE